MRIWPSEGVPNFVQTGIGLTNRHAVVEQDGKVIARVLPIAQRHGPVQADVLQCQVEQFRQRVGAGLKLSSWCRRYNEPAIKTETLAAAPMLTPLRWLTEGQ